jgi:hypothetical protein
MAPMPQRGRDRSSFQPSALAGRRHALRDAHQVIAQQVAEVRDERRKHVITSRIIFARHSRRFAIAVDRVNHPSLSHRIEQTSARLM